MKKIAFLTIFASLSIGVVNAETQTNPMTATTAAPLTESIDYPPALKKAAKAGIEVKKGFATGTDMMGWYATVKGQDVIVYTPPSGDAVLIGALLDEDGKNLTTEHQASFFPKPDYSKMISSIQDAAYYVQGNPESKNIVYGFHEPNCGYCAKSVNIISKIEGDYQVRWLPVAFLAENSASAAHVLLHSHDVIDDMIKIKAGFIDLPVASSDTLAAIDYNGNLMKEFGIKGTPAFFKIENGNIDLRPGFLPAEEMKAFIGVN